MKRAILISLILVISLSCTKTIDFNDEEYANQVVVNSFISTDNKFSLYLTKSNSILETMATNPPLEGTVDLYEDDALIKHFDTKLGAFSADDLNLAAGKSYKVVVVSNDKTVEAETNIPEKVEVISVDTTTFSNDHRYKIMNYKVKIKDPVGDDYYRMVIVTENLSFYTYTDSNGNHERRYSLWRSPSGIQSNDPVFKGLYNSFGNEVLGDGPSNDYSIFQDNYFQGKEYVIQFQGSGFSYGNNYSPNGNGYSGYGNPSDPNLVSGTIYERKTIHIQKLSKDFFNYLKYINLYNYYRDDPFSEPVPVYSNVKNGAGIFAGYNDDSKITFEKIYIPYSMDTIKVEKNNYGYGEVTGY